MASENDPLLEKRAALQHQIETGKYRTIYYIVLDATSRLIGRLTRSVRPIPFWYSATVLGLLQILITSLLPLILGEAPIYRVEHSGITPGRLVGGMVINFLTGIVSILVVEGRFRKIFRILARQLLDKVTSEANLVDIQRWLSAASDVRKPLFSGLVYTLVIAPYNTVTLSSFVGSFIGVGGIFFNIITCFASGIGLYYLFLMISFHARIRNYHFHLYPLDPSNSEEVHILSRILSGNVYVFAGVIALGTLIFGFVGVLPVYGIVIVLVGWIPVLFVFILHYSSLDMIVRQAKRDALYDLQAQIEACRTHETPPSIDTLEHVNKLMDFYDRINHTGTSTINLRAFLTLLNSLVLPLVAFILSNLDKIQTLLDTVVKKIFK